VPHEGQWTEREGARGEAPPPHPYVATHEGVRLYHVTERRKAINGTGWGPWRPRCGWFAPATIARTWAVTQVAGAEEAEHQGQRGAERPCAGATASRARGARGAGPLRARRRAAGKVEGCGHGLSARRRAPATSCRSRSGWRHRWI
jgi:hypothetical protein